MRRIIIIGTALAVLGAAAVALAANFNNYSGSNLAISRGVHGPLGMLETLKATAPAGQRAAPLYNIKFTIYGVKLDAGKLPVCTDAMVLSNKSNPNGGCPSGSVIGDGRVNALLGPGSDSSASKGVACNPYLHAFNGGPRTQVFYFYTKSPVDCAGLVTGATAPYDGHISYRGGSVVVNVPLPPDISTKVANQPGLYGSLIKQVETYSARVNGKVYMAGVACKGGQRPWSITFTAQRYNNGGSETQTVTGSSKC